MPTEVSYSDTSLQHWEINLLVCRFGLSHRSSFNDKPINDNVVGPIGKELFEHEQNDLLADLKDIPRKACDRRVSVLEISLLFEHS